MCNSSFSDQRVVWLPRPLCVHNLIRAAHVKLTDGHLGWPNVSCQCVGRCTCAPLNPVYIRTLVGDFASRMVAAPRALSKTNLRSNLTNQLLIIAITIKPSHTLGRQNDTSTIGSGNLVRFDTHLDIQKYTNARVQTAKTTPQYNDSSLVSIFL